MKKELTKTVLLRCDCLCSMLVVDKTIYRENDINFNISIQDSRYDHNFNTIWGRIKRACKILFGKPIYYSDINFDNPQILNNFVRDLDELAKWQGD